MNCWGASGTPAKFGRVLEGPPAGRVGAQKHTPSRRPGTRTRKKRPGTPSGTRPIGVGGLRPGELLGPAALLVCWGLRPVEVLGCLGVGGLRPVELFMRLGVGLNDRTRCRGVLNTPHRAPRHGANACPWAFIHSGPGGPFGEAYAIRPYRGTCIRHVHSAPFGGVRGAYAVAPRGFAAPGFRRPGVSPPRVSPWAMVRRAYRPLRVRAFGPCGPFGGAYAVAPRGFAARGFAAQGFAPGYDPAALQAAPGTCIWPLSGPFGGRMQYAPTPVRSFAPMGR